MSRVRFRHVAPAGAPIRAVDLARWLVRLPFTRHAVEDLEAAFRRVTGVAHCRATRTGRAGLTLLLRALRRLAPPSRDEVIVPSYTCWSVPASVVKAGLRVRLVDIDPATLDFDPAALDRADFSRVLAIVATNLYGIPNDLPRLSAVARREGVFLVDDAAQALGARVGGRLSGTWGDAGLYSLDKGKNVSAIDGGLVVTHSDRIAEALDAELAGLPSPGAGASVAGIVKAVAYLAFLRPWLYWIPNGIPQLGLGTTVFRTDFPLERPATSLAVLGTIVVNRLEELTKARRATASALVGGLREVDGIRLIAPPIDAAPAYLRLPVVVEDPEQRDRLIKALVEAGVGASGSYPACLADVAELQGTLAAPVDARGGRHVARRIVTLPTHSYVVPRDADRVLAVARTVVGQCRLAVGDRASWSSPVTREAQTRHRS